jgi:ribosomal protein L11 methyltransferase
MMQNSIQIKIPVDNPDTRDQLIAQLNEACYEGFEEEETGLLAYCPEPAFDEAALGELLAPYNLVYQKAVIPAQNWNEVWESNFSPVTVDDFVAVRAEFHAPILGVEHEIVITPKMSFGTGHHATTRMMMQQMRQLDFTGKKVFDFGTGTGILAILAEMLGAANVVAADNDEWCITNATENTERNHCQKVSLILADVPPAGMFDIILANINKNIILQFLPVLSAMVNTGGYVLLSGLLAEDEQDVLVKCGQSSLQHLSTIALDKWICILVS